MNYFRKIDGTLVSLKSYIPEILKKSMPGVSIYIGSDSQNYSDSTIMVTVLAFRYKNKGCHIIYKKESIRPKIKIMETRLLKEAEYTIELAQSINDQFGITPILEFDVNKSPNAGSNKVYAAVEGWGKGLGFSVLTKPDDMIATRAADVLC